MSSDAAYYWNNRVANCATPDLMKLGNGLHVCANCGAFYEVSADQIKGPCIPIARRNHKGFSPSAWNRVRQLGPQFAAELKEG